MLLLQVTYMTKSPKPGFTVETVSGNIAASHVAYAFSEVAAIYPITPSSDMAEMAAVWNAKGRNNIFGQPMRVVEMQSEAGAAGAVHGILSGGATATTFTASQGLLLMIPNMYKIAGELMPTVFHVSARAIAGQALSIFGDHQDVMACRATGFAMLASNSVQEVADMALVAHLATLGSSVPFLHFFEGFRISHEYQKVELPTYELLAGMLDHEALQKHRDRALNPEHPHLRGTAQNPDIYFQATERSNPFYQAVPEIVAEMMAKVSKITGRSYNLFDYEGAPDAERVVVIMGSAGDVVGETVNYLANQGEKVGVLKVRLFRPFSASHFIEALPDTVKRIAVLDRTKESGSQGEPLYLDVITALKEMDLTGQLVVGGRYGLGSKDFNPAMAKALFDNLALDEPKNHFTIGIDDDVSHTSLPVGPSLDTAPAGTIQCKFWGIGGDGTVGANQDAIKIIGTNTGLFAQAYFAYDAKKTGGVTVSHLRFGKEPIRSHYLIDQADYIACHNSTYPGRYDLLAGLKEGGTFVLNTPWTPEEMEEKLPGSLKRALAERKAKFYVVNADEVAAKVGLGNRINMVMQSIFFKLANVIPVAEALDYLKEAILTTYAKKGPEVVAKNHQAVDNALGAMETVKVPASWAEAELEADFRLRGSDGTSFVDEFMTPIVQLKGDQLPVSATTPGMFLPPGTSRYEKRGVGLQVPVWKSENCIQCNICSLVCPHAAIRPVLLTPEEAESAPTSFETIKAMTRDKSDLRFRVQVSPLDCMSCTDCVVACPAKTKALEMQPQESQMDQQALFAHSRTYPTRYGGWDRFTVRGSQFSQPLLEFSGACAGCGETAYVKLLTQLFGERMIIANATGCSSIWGGSAPSNPYTTNAEGHGPAWANSLFEDNAEYGFGISLASQERRRQLVRLVERVLEGKSKSKVPAKLKTALAEWLEHRDEPEAAKEHSDTIKAQLERDHNDPALGRIWNARDMLVPKSQWVIGGDGWAYDIGYGGLDHVMALNENVNILVLDTEVYSNTGGQTSKSTPIGAIAKFAAAGKETPKKNLGLMAMAYGNVYVASISMGANNSQCLKALREAEEYDGPSLILAYSPCISHGLMNGGMAKTQEEMKAAVKSGYWPLYRYDPRRAQDGKNPFQLDYKAPDGKIHDFIMNEVRYAALARSSPERAQELHNQLEQSVETTFERYRKMAE